MKTVIALDLEGTLISNGMSQIPRPGLYDFLENLRVLTADIVLFTTLGMELTKQIQQTLADEGSVPEWFRALPYVEWEGEFKDIGFVKKLYEPEKVRVLLIDDYEGHAVGQEDSVVLVKQFESPYLYDDVLVDLITGIGIVEIS